MRDATKERKGETSEEERKKKHVWCKGLRKGAEEEGTERDRYRGEEV